LLLIFCPEAKVRPTHVIAPMKLARAAFAENRPGRYGSVVRTSPP
jgi:hypothetical protein